MYFQFSAGRMFGYKQVAGSAVPTPVEFGALQAGSVEFSASTKELYGTFQFPIAVARATGKIAVKADFASIDADVFNDIYFGNLAAATNGKNSVVLDEYAVIPSSTPYTYTVANTATFAGDRGVVYALTGQRLTAMPSTATLATGEYSVSATGEYTFAAADAGISIKICYLNDAATGGKVVQITNQLLGVQVFFAMELQTQYGPPGSAQQATIHLNQVISDKLSFSTKTEDWMIPSLEGSAMADASGTIGYISIG